MDWTKIAFASLKAGGIAAIVGAVLSWFVQHGDLNEVVISALFIGAVTTVITFAISGIIATRNR